MRADDIIAGEGKAGKRLVLAGNQIAEELYGHVSFVKGRRKRPAWRAECPTRIPDFGAHLAREISRRNGFAFVKTLVFIAPDGTQKLQLVFRFDTFGDHAKSQAVRQCNDCPYDGGIVAVG